MTTDHATTADVTSDHAADIDKHVRVYITVFVALMVLTIVTVAISRLHLSTPVAVTALMTYLDIARRRGELDRTNTGCGDQ